MPLFYLFSVNDSARSASPRKRLSKRWAWGLRALFGVACLTLLGAGCSDDKFGPGDATYSLGAACYGPSDCATGFCCTSPPCGHGMCSYRCRSHLDCPAGSLCDAGVCFWACAIDADCGWNQSCKKAHTVCQY